MNHQRIIRLLLLASLIGCGDLATVPDRVPTSLAITPDTLIMTEGQADRIAIRVLDQDGQAFSAVPSWAEPVWQASESDLLSFIAGEARALAPGATEASVSLAGLSATGTVLVNPAALDLDIAAAYLTQATQRPGRSVPLVAGRDALLRVFLRGGETNFFQPAVRVTLHRPAGSTRTLRLEREGLGVPRDVRRDSLASSWNVEIPGSLIEPGLEIVVEADPDGLVPLAAGSEARLPAQGTLPLNVVHVPAFYLRYVPVYLTAFGTLGQLDPSSPIEFSRLIYEQFPLNAMAVDVRGIFYSDARLDTEYGWSQLLYEIAVLRVLDGASRYYYGVVEAPGGTNIAGIGYLGGLAALGMDDRPGTAAHELGHNFGLPHAPCGGPASPDPSYPYAGGSIGTFGYSVATGQLFDPSVTADLMTYCDPSWISDYNYMNALAFRDFYDWGMSGGIQGRTGRRTTAESRSAAAASRPAAAAGNTTEVLILWGGAEDGRLVLQPAFRTNAPASLPQRDGPYRIDGFDGNGAPVFSISFAGQAVDHRVGTRHFAFALPLGPGELDRLHRLVLSGPEGSVERVSGSGTRPAPTIAGTGAQRRGRLSWSPGDYPAALVRDRTTGRVIGIDRDGRFELPRAAAGFEVLLSDGVQTLHANLR